VAPSTAATKGTHSIASEFLSYWFTRHSTHHVKIKPTSIKSDTPGDSTKSNKALYALPRRHK
jgi:hypothetical protein